MSQVERSVTFYSLNFFKTSIVLSEKLKLAGEESFKRRQAKGTEKFFSTSQSLSLELQDRGKEMMQVRKEILTRDKRAYCKEFFLRWNNSEQE